MIPALWQLGRPRLLVHLLSMVLGGFGWAHWNRALVLTGADRLGWVCLAWVALHFGTMWLNAAVDRDEGEVFFGKATPVPPRAATAGFAALIAAVVLAAQAGPWPLAATSTCAALAVAYSHPALLWKGHPGFGPAVNALGYGVLTPMVGWSCVGVPLDPRTVAMVSLTAIAVLGAYFSAQAFQAEEDRARGYRTLVVTHGPAVAVDAAYALLTASWVGLMALALVGWLPRPLLLAGPAWWWVHRWFERWRAAANGGTEAHARELARRVGWVSLLAFVLVFAEYARESLVGEPVAGFGTAAGHPTALAAPPTPPVLHAARRSDG